MASVSGDGRAYSLSSIHAATSLTYQSEIEHRTNERPSRRVRDAAGVSKAAGPFHDYGEVDFKVYS